MRAFLHLEFAYRSVPCEVPEGGYLFAPVLLIKTVKFQTFQLIFERYRNLHHFYAPAAEGAECGERMRLRLPLVDALGTEHVPALRALFGIS